MIRYVTMFLEFFLGTMGIVLGLLLSLMVFTIIVKTLTKVQKFFLRKK